MMPVRLRLLRQSVAVVALLLGAALLLSAGLPNRTDYTGQVLAGLGYAAPEVGAFAPPFRAQSLDGTPFDLYDALDTAAPGQTLILNFWATWCVPCQVEMPLLQAIAAECPEAVRVVGINAGEAAARVAEWVKTNALRFAILVDERQQLQALYRVPGLPTTFVIAPNRRVAAVFYGLTPEPALRAALADCTVD